MDNSERGTFMELGLDHLSEEQFLEERLVKRALVLEEVPRLRGAEAADPDVTAAAIALTFAFEGSGYTQVTGDFDGAGLSLGGLQWCLGPGSLQPLLRRMHEGSPKEFNRCLGYTADLTWDVARGAVPWPKLARLINYTPPKYALKTPYKEHFQELCKTLEFQSIQRDACANVMRKAINYCIQYDLKSRRALSLLFDVCVQNGSVHGPAMDAVQQARAQGVDEEGFLKALATGVAQAAKPRWQQDVLSRKMTIAVGQGTVHGTSYTLSDRGLTMRPWRAATTV